ncbi:hypothetical protein MPSEU_000728000 [Mayamaea pseudoterrestris]|nr:hypothetical protein MPSEU_000727500 [Mayamaea pseudoterrestris]GKY97698.1 hypothetical protein MPSEU_000728000 [Mayamaea pseudoterrestris]
MGRILLRIKLLLVVSLLLPSSQARHVSRQLISAVSQIRGGSTKAASASKDDIKTYRLQQQLCLQTRSFQLRQALVKRGLDALQVTPEQNTIKVVDWDCALSTEENPMSCAYSFDAEPGTKVVAPIGSDLRSNTAWVTLSSLNRLRRNDPTKVDPLWHSQYAILRTWFRPDSQFSLYNHLTPLGTLLSLLLDAPVVLAAVMAGTIFIALLLTLPLWEKLLSAALTSRFLWIQWPSWGRFVHAALPLKLLLGQMAYKALAVSFYNVYNRIRTQLIEWECQIWQDCIPLTIIPPSEDDTEIFGETEARTDGG